jgi:hypothetical protein
MSLESRQLYERSHVQHGVQFQHFQKRPTNARTDMSWAPPTLKDREDAGFFGSTLRAVLVWDGYLVRIWQKEPVMPALSQ